MQGPGAKLREMRQRLGFTMREVEAASRLVTRRRGSNRYLISASRLSDIENRGVVPNVFRLYTLAVVYGQSLPTLLSWCGVRAAAMAGDRKWLRERHG